jgi:hypothetical protein
MAKSASEQVWLWTSEAYDICPQSSGTEGVAGSSRWGLCPPGTNEWVRSAEERNGKEKGKQRATVSRLPRLSFDE